MRVSPSDVFMSLDYDVTAVLAQVSDVGTYVQHGRFRLTAKVDPGNLVNELRYFSGILSFGYFSEMKTFSCNVYKIHM